MADLNALFRTLDSLTPEEKQRVIAYLQQPAHTAAPAPKKRIPGLHEHLGHAWMSDDFDDELPDSFWLGEDETLE